MLRGIPSRSPGTNYHPSHLIRMGIAHAHGKDTKIISENPYEIGLYRRSIFREPYFCGEFTWRYTTPATA